MQETLNKMPAARLKLLIMRASSVRNIFSCRGVAITAKPPTCRGVAAAEDGGSQNQQIVDLKHV